MIEIEQLEKQFYRRGNTFHALNGINLHIQKGEIFSIIGQSGAGKTTLLRTFNLLERPTRGRVVVDGLDLTALGPKALREARHHISMVFQHFHLVQNKTVFDNVALPLLLLGEKNYDNQVNKLLQLVDLKDKMQAYPRELSGGQKQRVAIARALATHPKLLLCDEITSALDPNTTQQILALLKKINKQLNVTIVLITHEMYVVKAISDRFAVMSKGRITEVTRLEDVFTQSRTTHLLLDNLKPKLPTYIKDKMKKRPKKGYYPLCQVTFLGEITQRAIISELTERLGIKINILQANIDAIANNTFGILTFQLVGDEKQIDDAFDFFNAEQLAIEVLGYVE